MPRHLSIVFSSFWLHLLLLLLMGGGNAAASTDGQEGPSRSLELFKSGTSQVVSRRPGESGDGTIRSFKGHSLVVVNGVLVALAKAEYKVGRYTEEKMLAKSIDIENKTVTGRAQAITVGDKGEKWKTELVIEKERAVNRDLPLYGPRAVVKGNEIFVLVMSYNESRRNEPHGVDWNAELYVGDVATKPKKDGGAITWRAPTSLRETFKAQLAKNSSWINFMFDTGRGIALEDTTIVFPLVGETRNRKRICTVIYSEDGWNNWKFPSRSLISEDCKDSSLIEWDGKLIMITTSDYSARRVYESTDKGKTWAESTGEHAHVLGRFLKEHEASDRVDFLTATINGKSAVLFTRRGENNDKYGFGYQKVFHLWLYYNRRIYQVGPISLDGVQSYMFGSLLYREGELFFLYEKSDGRNTQSLVLVHLTDQMRRIRSLLDTWDAMDRRVVQLLHSTPKEGGSTEKNTRTKDMSTSGLVGFLSDRSNGNQWIDEYLWLNASVKGATNTSNGLKFEGNGGGAKWPVGDPKMKKLYSFADHGLTLLATVAINKTPEKSTPLLRLGLRLPWSQRNVGLWYDENNLWKGITNDGKENDASKVTSWKVGEEYQVILTMDKGESSVYINGSYMGKLEQRTLHGSSSNSMSSFGRHDSGDTRPEEILFICFGACEKDEHSTEIHMAVKNVILYNRPFNFTEIEKLKKEEVTVGQTTVERGANNGLPSTNTHNSSSSPAQPEVSYPPDTPPQEESVSKDPNGASEEHNSQPMKNSAGDGAKLKPLTTLVLALLAVLFGVVTFCLVPKIVSYFYPKEKTLSTPQFITEPL